MAAALAAAALAIGLLPATSSPAQAASRASVTLTRADIVDGRLVLAGTVANIGTTSLTGVTAALWRSSSPLRSASAVTGALTAATTTAGTAAVVADGNRDTLTPSTLTPGDSRPFTVSGELAALGLRTADASFWVGVDVRGRTGAGAAHLASDRTLVTRASDVPLAAVVSFSAPPRQLKTNLFLDDALAGEIATGRLAALMDAAESGHADWVLDPSLQDELTDMADGYRVQTSDGNTAGTGADAARAWLDRLAALPAGSGAAGLFGAPDLGAAAELGADYIAASAARASEAAPAGLTPVAVLPQADAATLRALGPARTAIVPATGAHGVAAASGGVRVLFTTPAQPAALSSPVLRNTGLNRGAAQTALARVNAGQLTWLTSADDVQAASGRPPEGFRRASLAELLALTPQTWTPPARAEQDGPLDPDRLTRIQRLGASLALVGEIAPEAGIGEVADAQVARAASGWWIGEPAGQQVWLDAIDRRLALPQGDFVTLTTTSRFSMTGATSEFPVTITNHLADPVAVRVEAVSDNPQRIALVGPEPLTIAPGAGSTAILRAEAAGGGVVQATVRATTLGGRTLTPDVPVVVETTNFGTVGWVIVLASGIVLVVTTALRIRRVRNQRKGEDG